MRRTVLRTDDLKPGSPLTTFQLCLWYWIETELRVSQYLGETGMPACLVRTEALAQQTAVKGLFEQLGIEHSELDLEVARNENVRPTHVSDSDREEWAALAARLPGWVWDKMPIGLESADAVIRDEKETR